MVLTGIQLYQNRQIQIINVFGTTHTTVILMIKQINGQYGDLIDAY